MTRYCLIALCIAGLVGGTGAKSVKVMSYNILHGTDVTSSNTLLDQGWAIKREDADFVGLQEVDERCRRSGVVDQMAKLAEQTGMHAAFAPHIDYQGGRYGIGLLSRYPLSDIRNDRISLFTTSGTVETRALLSAVATFPDGTTVTMATVHMGLNAKTRVAQAEEIVDFLSARGGSVILTGDFNAEPGTEELGILEKMFVIVGDQTKFTFPVGEASKTIDYILVSREHMGKLGAYRVMLDVPYSDHYPIVAEFELQPARR